MKIAKKYTPTSPELRQIKAVSKFVKADDAVTNECCSLIVCSYFKTLSEKKLLKSWGEETVTHHIKKHLRKCISERGLTYSVTPEYPEDDEAIEDGLKAPLRQVYFDLVFTTFKKKQEYFFGVEAKIVIENNFLKRYATQELSEYISNKGMRKYLDGIYKKNGCMIGYVMEGSTDAIVKKINDIILSSNLFSNNEILGNRISIDAFEHCYESVHPLNLTQPLKHLFLDFSMVEQN